jgi:hypothetical protein
MSVSASRGTFNSGADAMNAIRTALAVAVLATLAGSSLGQESQAPPATPEAEAATPTPTPPPRAPVSDDEFIPTQELQADEEVTFPVDI